MTSLTGQSPQQVLAGVTEAARRLGLGSELWVRTATANGHRCLVRARRCPEGVVGAFVAKVAGQRSTCQEHVTPDGRVLGYPVWAAGDVSAVLLVTVASRSSVSGYVVEALVLLGVATAAAFAEERRRREEYRFADGLRRQALRDADVVARLGGDELVVLLRDLPTADAATPAAERLAEALREPFLLDGVTLDVEASLSVAVPGAR